MNRWLYREPGNMIFWVFFYQHRVLKQQWRKQIKKNQNYSSLITNIFPYSAKAVHCTYTVSKLKIWNLLMKDFSSFVITFFFF